MKRKMKLRREELPKMIDRLKKKPSPFLIRDIGLARHPMAIPHLAEVLKNNPDPEIRQAAAVALGMIPHRSAVLTLEKALKDKNLNVRLAAANSLDNLILFGYMYFPEYIYEERKVFSSTLDGHLHTDVQYLSNVLKNDPTLRRKLRAAYLLTPASICLCSPWKDDLSYKEECIKIFTKGIKDKDYINRLLSIYGLTKVALYCGDNDKNSALNILETYLPKEKNGNVKSEIKDAIKKIKGEFEK